MKRAMFWMVLFLLTLGVCEVLVRATLTPPGHFPLDPKEDPLYEPHPIRGYTLKANTHADYVTPDIDIDIDIGPDGLRDSSLASIRRADFRVLAVGNSFTLGLGVAAEHTWSKQLERLLEAGAFARAVHVINAGVPGYSPRQIRLHLSELLPKVEPHIVIFGLTTETYTRMQTPIRLYGGTLVRSDAIERFRITPRGLVYSPLERAWMRAVDQWLNQYWHLGAHALHILHLGWGLVRHVAPATGSEPVVPDFAETSAAMAPTLSELARARDLAVTSGASFMALLINLQDPDGTFGERQALQNRILNAFCVSQRLVCVDPLPELRRRAAGRLLYRTRDDQHWTPEAHAVAANALLERVRTLSDLPFGSGEPGRSGP